MLHRIVQVEGGEQGDPLVPLLFSLRSTTSCNTHRGNSEPTKPCSLSWTTCVLRPDRIRVAYDTLGEKLLAHAGIRLHTGNTTARRRAALCPRGMAELGPEVWNAEGVNVLGTPMGSRRFVEEVVNQRLEEETKLWDLKPAVPDAAWPAHDATNMLRTLPPSQSEEHAEAHDARMMRVMHTLVALSSDHLQVEVAHNLASLPMRMGEIGFKKRSEDGAIAGRQLPQAHGRRIAEGCLKDLRNGMS